MRELLLGWKDKSEVYIPPIKKQGFTEDVILRNINLPEEENLIPDLEENADIDDYVIKDNPMISRKHARIYQRDCNFWLEDLNSLNHTFVNDKVISEPVKLIPGMKFRLSLDEEFKVIEIMEN